jgi:hypothetical protein
VPPFDAGSTRRLDDHGTDGGVRGRTRIKVSWDLDALHTADDRWEGAYHSKFVFRRRGSTVKSCSTRFTFDLLPA